MQRYHRRRHRLAWVVIAIVLPVVLAIGLLKRKPVPTVESVPGGAQEATHQHGN